MMGADSKIEWTDDTFNPWIGCTKIAPECAHCYAEELMDRRYGKAQWGPSGTRRMTAPANWAKPVAWNQAAEKEGVRRKVFCASLADVFEDWTGVVFNHTRQRLWVERAAPRDGFLAETPQGSFSGCRLATMDDLRVALFALIDATPWLDWLLLTKRPENVRRMWPGVVPRHARQNVEAGERPIFRPNVWIGTSCGHQSTADKAIPELIKCRDLSPVLFLSCEPLLGPVDLENYLGTLTGDCGCSNCEEGFTCPAGRAVKPGVDWVIAGGESGREARPVHPSWVRSIRDQCQAAGVPFFFKQWGEWRPKRAEVAGGPAPMAKGDGWGVLDPSGVWFPRQTPWNGRELGESETGECSLVRAGKAAAGAILDGREWREFPKRREP